jgi:hypothetical protein
MADCGPAAAGRVPPAAGRVPFGFGVFALIIEIGIAFGDVVLMTPGEPWG